MCKFFLIDQVGAIVWTALNIKCRSKLPTISFSFFSFPPPLLKQLCNWGEEGRGERKRMALLMFVLVSSGRIGNGNSILE